METCLKRVVSECTPADWVVNSGTDPDDPSDDEKARQYLGLPYDENLQAGTTAKPANTAAIDPTLDPTNPYPYPRRIAFLRTYSPSNPSSTSNDQLELSNNKPIVLGVNASGKIACYTYTGQKQIPNRGTCRRYTATNKPRTSQNALWFATTTNPNNPTTTAGINYGYNNPLAYLNDPADTNQRLRTGGTATKNQPLLVPVLQLQYPTAVSGGSLATIAEARLSKETQWLPKADGNSIFNLAMATGDNPSHPPFDDHEGDFNGGLPNLPRFIENWQGVDTEINGSFIQIKRSSYATAPNTQLPNQTGSVAPFVNYPQAYQTGNNFKKTPSYEPPGRTWGFDVGLLSQLPDLFAKQFTGPPAEKPNEFFREVNRDDDWVRTLLCAKTLDGGNEAINDDQRPKDFCDDKAGG